MATLELKKITNIFLSIGRYIFSADVIFFESRLEIFTSPSFFVSEIDYDNLFYREPLLNSSETTSENVTSKDTLRFQDPIKVYT